MHRWHRSLLPPLLTCLIATGGNPTEATEPLGAAEDPSPAEVRRADGYRGIWFTLGQFYGPGSDGEPYGPRQRTPTFPYG